MKCPNCGQPIPENAMFCGKCGTALKVEQPAPSMEIPAILETPASEETPAPEEALKTAAAVETPEKAYPSTEEMTETAEAAEASAADIPAEEQYPQSVQNYQSTQYLQNEQYPQSAQNYQNTQYLQNEQYPQSAQNYQNTQYLQNEQYPQSAQYTQNEQYPQSAQNYQNAQYTQNIQYTQNAQNYQNEQYYRSEPYAQSMPQPETVKKPAFFLSKRTKGARSVLTVFLSILMFLSALSALCVTALRAFFTEENVAALIDDIDLLEINIVTEDGETINIIDYIADMSDYGDGVWNRATEKKKIEAFMKKSFIKEFAVEIVEMYRAYLFDNVNTHGIDAGTLVDMVESKEKQITKALIDFTEDNDVYIVFDELEDQLDNQIGDLFTTESLLSRYGSIIEPVKFVVSDFMMYIFWGFTALFAVIIILLNLRDASAVFMSIAVPAVIFGLLMIAAAGIAMNLPGAGTVLDASGMLKSYLTNLIIIGSITAGAGVLLIVLSCLFKHIMKKYEKMG